MPAYKPADKGLLDIIGQYRLNFESDAFARQNIAALPDTWRAYTAQIRSMNKTVKALDRYDDFATMKIPPRLYRENTEGPIAYGIHYDHAVHGDEDVVLNHQHSAAHTFLQKLRGFGLLADVVGSGKTYEACTVLSELAARGVISTMLLIVPRHVYDEWVRVLEIRFGLGKDILYQYPHFFDKDGNPLSDVKQPNFEELVERCPDGFARPKRPIIVATEDFLLWQAAMNECLYDVIVMDEAHHMCEEDENGYSPTLYQLSKLTAIKKKADKPYCLLLTATPHSGDLDKMFRLWYFIRCQGGSPEEFAKEPKRRASYHEEHKYYTETICRGATSVRDFINRMLLRFFLGELYVGDFSKFYESEYGRSFDGFSELAEGEKIVAIEKYLEQCDDRLYEKASQFVADAYHNDVLRSIMIRNPKSTAGAMGRIKTKTPHNIFFFPAKKTSGNVTLPSIFAKEQLTLHIDNLADPEGKGIVTVDGKPTYLADYLENRGNRKFTHGQLLFYNEVWKALGLTDESFTVTFDAHTTLRRRGALTGFYSEQFRAMSDSVKLNFYPMAKMDADSIFKAKLDYTIRLLRQHKNERVLIFFDYDKKPPRGEASVAERVEDALRKMPEFASRILENTVKKLDDEFRDKEGAILVAKQAGITEGRNLQSCAIVINFEVTPDPVAMEQRIGRVFRLGQKSNVTIYSLANMCDLEGYVLMYYTRIGLIESNSGDATIIAGAINNNMVSVRCEKCGRVKLYSRENYEVAKRNPEELMCRALDMCRLENPEGTMMTEINVYDFRCTECGNTFVRSTDGYECLSMDRGIMCNSGRGGDRMVYCNKACAMLHCQQFMPGGEYEHCGALALYKKGITDPIELRERCNRCENKCPPRCRYGEGPEAIQSCSSCRNSTCQPVPPMKLVFNEKWEAPCPICVAEGRRRGGKLVPVVARTFSSYVQALWNFHFDENAFCDNLRAEAKKVATIRDILDNDKMREGER